MILPMPVLLQTEFVGGTHQLGSISGSQGPWAEAIIGKVTAKTRNKIRKILKIFFILIF